MPTTIAERGAEPRIKEKRLRMKYTANGMTAKQKHGNVRERRRIQKKNPEKDKNGQFPKIEKGRRKQ